MENEIEKILLSIQKKEIRTFNDIKIRREMAIDELFDDFMCYPRNQVNIVKIKEELEDYELVDMENIHKNDIIKVCDKRFFFDISIKKYCVSGIRPDNTMWLKVYGSQQRKLFKEGPFFKKLTEEDKVKISLIEAVYSENRT